MTSFRALSSLRARATTAAIDACRTGMGSGRFEPFSRYGKLNVTTSKPAVSRARARRTIPGSAMLPPAPCAQTKTATLRANQAFPVLLEPVHRVAHHHDAARDHRAGRADHAKDCEHPDAIAAHAVADRADLVGAQRHVLGIDLALLVVPGPGLRQIHAPLEQDDGTGDEIGRAHV